MTLHAHVLDPGWGTAPISWAPEADPTLVPRLHAACLDECRDCLEQIGADAASDATSTALLLGMAFAMMKSLPPHLLPAVKGAVPFGAPMWLLIERIEAAGDHTNGPEVRAMLAEMDTGDRHEVVNGCIGMMELYASVMRGESPAE